jgi:hypothetical protein
MDQGWVIHALKLRVAPTASDAHGSALDNVVHQGLVSSHTGHNRLNRLLFVANKRTGQAELDALRMAHDDAKKVCACGRSGLTHLCQVCCCGVPVLLL